MGKETWFKKDGSIVTQEADTKLVANVSEHIHEAIKGFESVIASTDKVKDLVIVFTTSEADAREVIRKLNLLDEPWKITLKHWSEKIWRVEFWDDGTQFI